MAEEQPVRVLTVLSKHLRGGHTRRLYMLIEALLSQGKEVHYLSAEELPLPEHARLIPYVVPVPFTARHGLLFWIFFCAIGPLVIAYRLLVTRFSAIVVSDPIYSLLAKPASVIAGVPIVLFMRAVPWRVNALTKRRNIFRAIEYGVDALGLLSAHRIVAVTSTMQNELSARLPALASKLVVLPNSAVLPRSVSKEGGKKLEEAQWEGWHAAFASRKRHVCALYGFSERAFLLATSSELDARKNIEHLLRALAAAETDRLALVVCGDGPERARLTAVAAGFGLNHQVAFVGWVADPQEIISGCDLFVMPSRHEGMSNSMLEALGLGVAVIAADTPEMREVLHHDALLFNTDDVGDLSSKLYEISRSRSKLEELRKLSFERLRLFTFDWGQSVSDIIDQTTKKY